MTRRLASRTAVLIGRDEELTQLRRALDAAADGRGSCWFVLGEAGSGKTRLVSELLAEARAEGHAVVAAGASDAVRGPAYGLLSRALRSHLRGSRMTDPRLDAFAAGLTMVLPEWPLATTDTGVSADQRRLLAVEGVFQLLVHLAGPRGATRRRHVIVVSLDDLQWADPESLEVVHHLADGAADVPMLVVGAVRLAERSPAESLARHLARQGDAGLLELAALRAEQVRILVNTLLTVPAADPLVADIARRSAGLPLLVEEVLGAYQAEDALAVRNGRVVMSRPPAGLVPPTMAEWVASRVAVLDSQARAVVAAAAVLDRFDESLADVAEVDHATAERALNDAIDVAVLVNGPDGLRFRHDLTRDALLQLLLPTQAHALHQRAATALARAGAPPEERAVHLQAVGERDAAAALLVEAARRNLEAHGLASGEQLAVRALQLSPHAASVAGAHDVLAMTLAEQGRWAEALEVDRRLLATGRTDASLVGRAVSTALHAGSFHEAADLLFSDAGKALPDPPRRRLEATVALGRGELEASVGLATASCRSALDQHDVADACASLDVLGRSLDLLGRADEAAAAFRRWAALADMAGLTTSKLHALVSLGGHQVLRGLPPTALWEARELGLATKSYLQLGWAELTLAYAVQFTRPAVEAVKLADDALSRARRFRLDVMPHALVAAGTARYPLDAAASSAVLGEALQLRPDDDDLAIIVGYARGMFALYEGRYDDAVGIWRECVDRMRVQRGGTPNDAPAVLPLALLAAGRRDEAEQALLEARTWPVHVFEYTFEALTGMADALLEGRPEQVILALEPMRRPEPFFRAGVLVTAAEIHEGEPRVVWLRDALDQFTWGGWERAATRVRQLLRAAGEPVPRTSRSNAALPAELRRAGVTGREADVLALVATGRTNAAVAQHLYVSVRTVESHVSSLLAKLGARNRTDLTARYLDLTTPGAGSSPV